MANFPQNPSADDTHQIGDKIWTWDGEKWFADYESLSCVSGDKCTRYGR